MHSLAEPGAPPDAEPPLKRKIAAILAADVAGYSRLVAEDEERTLRALADARRVFDEHVRRAGGRIFNTAGDSVMCDFDSAVEAVRAALRIQAEIASLNGGVPISRQLLFRVGITIGDVVERGDDLLGDGVNIAARLEGLAAPGGICISRSVHEAVANKVAAVFQDLGPRPVKNLPQPIHAFAYVPEGAAIEADSVSTDPRQSGLPSDPRTRNGGVRVKTLVRVGLILTAVSVGIPAFKALRQGSETLFQQPAKTAEPASAVDGQARAPTTSPVRQQASRTANVDTRTKPAIVGERSTADDKPATTVDRPAASGSPADPAALPESKGLAALYRDARLLEAKGDRTDALRVYATLAPLAGETIDPLVRYATLLRRASGPEAARKTMERLAGPTGSQSAALVAIMQLDAPDRIGKLDAIVADHPDYAPASYLLAQALTDKRKDGPTLTERRLAFSAFDRFLEAGEAGALAPLFVDQSFLEGWLDTARTRRSEIEAFFAGAATRPVATFSRAEGGWNAEIVLPEPATAVTARIGENGAPTPARTLPGSPQTLVTLFIPAATGRATLYVSYRDLARREAGPFPMVFDPGTAAASAGRETLERYPETWINFRPDLPNLVSFAQLAANRCAVRQALIGFGDEPPTRPVPLPACDGSAATAALPATRSFMEVPAGTDSVQVQLTYANGTESQVKTFRRP